VLFGELPEQLLLRYTIILIKINKFNSNIVKKKIIYLLMSDLKDLIKQHKKVEVQIEKITKLRLNDRTSGSWTDLRTLKKEKLKLKEKISRRKKN
jgi:uncharacterized protein YdcH (DUF465 family)